jgi:hypothetical protein
MELLEALSNLFGVPAALRWAAITFAAFTALDFFVSDELKAGLMDLIRSREHDDKQVSTPLVALFDLLYSQPLLSWPAFLRSVCISIAFAAVYAYEAGILSVLLKAKGIQEAWEFEIYQVLLPSLIVNILIDYGSLFYIRRRIVQSGDRPIRALLVSIVLVVSVFFLALSWRAYVAWVIEKIHPIGKWTLFYRTPLNPSTLMIPGMLVFAWLVLLALGILVLRVLNPFASTVDWLQWAIKDGQKRPLVAIGVVAAAIVFLVLAGWHWIFERL